MTNPFLFREKKASGKIVIVVLIALTFLTVYYIISSYYDYQKQELAKLNTIAKTLALQINGDEHEYLLEKYPIQGLIKSNVQDSTYHRIRNLLYQAYAANELKSEIATLYLDRADNRFYYVVNSTEKPYFRAPYLDYHKIFFTNYETGGVIGAYSDEFGTWLTAFAPIKNKDGKVVAIIEVDEKYADFLHLADKKLYTHLAISLLIFIFIAILLLSYVRRILAREEQIKLELQNSYRIINERTDEILKSIYYAERIQNAILPPEEVIKNNLPKSFVFYKPKDIVSGDFYFLYEVEQGKIFYIAACDCTGHGVPGALMSMLGNNLLNYHIQEDTSMSPAKVLNLLNVGVINALKQEGKYVETNDGMDISICRVDIYKRTIEFAGANRPLYILRDGNIIEHSGNKNPIGGNKNTSLTYTGYEFTIEKGDRYYLFSDGFADQFSELTHKKFLSKNLKLFLTQTSALSMDAQFQELSDTYLLWKGSSEQTDDILVLGFELF